MMFYNGCGENLVWRLGMPDVGQKKRTRMDFKDVLIIIQARLGSTRLPGKVLMDLGGKTVLERVIATCKSVTDTAVSIPWEEDERLQNAVFHSGVSGFYAPKGQNPSDVLERYAMCFSSVLFSNYKHIVRITADCPLISADLIRIAIKHHLAYQADYTRFKKITSGLDVEVFTREALEKAHLEATDPYDREHVTPWMRRNLKVNEITKLSLDTQEDLGYLRRIETYGDA